MSSSDAPAFRGDPASTEHGPQRARHGIAGPRGQDLPPGTRGGRFGRMFGFLPPRDPGADATEELFELLDTLAGGAARFNRAIPAGYTYLGQFIDHDITFDPTSVLGRDNDPQALVNFRTPRYDLDSLYGAGPRAQPYLYDRDGEHGGVKLLVGRNRVDPWITAFEQPARVDLPRNRQGLALIGDGRNDENLIVSQLHLLFIHFHNKVVDRLSAEPQSPRGPELFDEARRVVRWHYQWIVVHDFLERLVGRYTARCVLRPAAAPGAAATITRRCFSWQDEPAIPVEFSAAAFRCGHSMVRLSYQPNANPATRGTQILPSSDDTGHHLGGFRVLPGALVIGWEKFFDLTTGGPDPARSMCIDPIISKPLFALPDGQALPRLNLQRSRALGLPAGRDVAHAMGEEPLSFGQLHLDHDSLSKPCADALFWATPLWYYILCEAEARNQGRFLGPVGGRIVAEVLVGLLEGDPQSYLRQWPAWTPAQDAKALGLDGGIHTMPDLVRFARPPAYSGLP